MIGSVARAAVLLGAVSLFAWGCGGRVRYEPDRAVARSIPADKAQEGLRAALSRGDGVSSVTVDATHFEFASSRTGRYSGTYAQTKVAIFIEPVAKATGAAGAETFDVMFAGGNPGKGFILTNSREDAETIVDAITSLGGDVLPEAK